ncbi:MAG: hypothetical protein LIO71_00690 [Ruminococcus sp.]|nr:hypothetical protein [Ruminococcus sp.]
MSKNRKKKQFKKNGVVTISPIALIVGILCSILFLILTIGVYIGFGIFELLGISLIVAYFNCKIYYEPNQFTHKNFFGVKHTYKYSEITKIKYGTSDTIIYVGKKKISVDSMADSKDFLRLVNSKTNQSVKSVKEKLFNDNVYNAGEFIFAYGIVLVYIIGCMIFINILGKPLKLDDLICLDTKITSYEEVIDDTGDTNLNLTLEGYSANFVIYSYQDVMENFSQFESAISNGVEFNVYFDSAVEDFESTGSGIDMLTDTDGNTYVSLDTINAREKHTLNMVNLLMLIILIFYIIYVAIAFYVMSHADRFPRLIKLFVKEDYIKHKKS